MGPCSQRLRFGKVKQGAGLYKCSCKVVMWTTREQFYKMDSAVHRTIYELDRIYDLKSVYFEDETFDVFVGHVSGPISSSSVHSRSGTAISA